MFIGGGPNDGKQYSPYTVEQLREYVQQENFTTADYACCDGQKWVAIAEVPGLAASGDSSIGYTVDFAMRPLWLLRGKELTGQNDFNIGH